MKRIILIVTFLLSIVQLIGQSDYFLDKVLNNYSSTSPYICLLVTDKRDTIKCIGNNEDLLHIVYLSKRINSVEEYVSMLKYHISNNIPLYFDTIPPIPLEIVKYNIEVEESSQKGMEYFFNKYFKGKYFNLVFSDEECIAVIAKLFELGIACFNESISGHLVCYANPLIIKNKINQ